MPKVTFFRPKESFNKHQSYSIHIDGDQVTTLENDSRQSISLEKDQVEVHAKIKMWGSKKHVFDLTNQEELTLEVRGNKFYNRYAPMSGGLLPALMAVHFIFPDSQLMTYSLLTMGVFLILYIIFILTLDRDAWLTITQM
jgi:hypothetical protein